MQPVRSRIKFGTDVVETGIAVELIGHAPKGLIPPHHRQHHQHAAVDFVERAKWLKQFLQLVCDRYTVCSEARRAARVIDRCIEQAIPMQTIAGANPCRCQCQAIGACKRALLTFDQEIGRQKFGCLAQGFGARLEPAAP